MRESDSIRGHSARRNEESLEGGDDEQEAVPVLLARSRSQLLNEDKQRVQVDGGLPRTLVPSKYKNARSHIDHHWKRCAGAPMCACMYLRKSISDTGIGGKGNVFFYCCCFLRNCWEDLRILSGKLLFYLFICFDSRHSSGRGMFNRNL